MLIEPFIGSVGRDIGEINELSGNVQYLTIDTGAVRTVFPVGWAPPCVPILPTKASERGDFYWGAGSEKIYDLGGQIISIEVEDYPEPLSLRGAVCEVRKPLVSALALRDAGWDLNVGIGGSQLVQRSSGRTIALLERGGVPVLPVRVRPQRWGPAMREIAEKVLADFGSGSGGVAENKSEHIELEF